MTPPPDDLEQRLDGAFASSRPRPGFEAELRARLQSPPPRRRWLSGIWPERLAGVDLGPALAGLVVVALAGLGIFGIAHLPHGSSAGGASTSASRPSAADQQRQFQQGGAVAPAEGSAQLGTLPRPALTNTKAVELSTESGAMPYFDKAELSWSGSLPAIPALLPVYRWTEPQKADQDAFAAKLGAAPGSSPGAYTGPDFSLALFGANAANGREPIFAYTPKSSGTSLTTPADTAARKAAADFLAARNLAPAWDSAITVRAFNGLSSVRYTRQFAGPAVQVDGSGKPVGEEVLVKGDGSVFQVSGPQPLNLTSGQYRRAAQDAILGQVQQASTPGAVRVVLNQAELVYEAIPDGDHGFYVPALLFTGVFTQNGQQYEKRLLVQVLDSSQLR